MKYQLAVFDLDGTILNTLEDLCDGVNYALEQGGFPLRTLEEIRNFVGNGVRKLIERALPPGTDTETVERVLAVNREYYRTHCTNKTKPYEGMGELFGEMKKRGMKLAVLSNKADEAVKMLCGHYFPNVFDAAYGAREGVAGKPAADALCAILDEFSLGRQNVVYIGDSEVDIKTAENAGTDMIIVDWGFRSREDLLQNGAMNLVSAPLEILNIV